MKCKPMLGGLAVCLLVAGEGWTEPTFETAPVLRASDFVAPWGLQGTAGRADVIALAATLVSEDEARFLVWTLQILDRYQSSVGPITTLRVLGRTLVARVPGGGLVVPAGVDYIAWTPRLAEFARRAELQAVKDRAVWLSGRVSPRARRELTALGWMMKDDVLPMK